MVDLVDQWKEVAKRDDLFDHMVPSDVRQLIGEIERLRETNQRLNRRCQIYERGLAEKLRDAKTAGRSLAKGMLSAALTKADADNERLRAALKRLEEIYATDRIAAVLADEIEAIFDKHLHSSDSGQSEEG